MVSGEGIKGRERKGQVWLPNAVAAGWRGPWGVTWAVVVASCKHELSFVTMDEKDDSALYVCWVCSVV